MSTPPHFVRLLRQSSTSTCIHLIQIEYIYIRITYKYISIIHYVLSYLPRGEYSTVKHSNGAFTKMKIHWSTNGMSQSVAIPYWNLYGYVLCSAFWAFENCQLAKVLVETAEWSVPFLRIGQWMNKEMIWLLALFGHRLRNSLHNGYDSHCSQVCAPFGCVSNLVQQSSMRIEAKNFHLSTGACTFAQVYTPE